MRVLRKGPESTKITCMKCLSLLEIDPTDYTIIQNPEEVFGLVKCPVCDFDNKVNITIGRDNFIGEKNFGVELDRIKSWIIKDRVYGDSDMGLKYHSEVCKDNYEFCLNYVKFEARNLAFVPDKHRDYNMCIEAVKTLALSISENDDFSESNIENLMTLFLIPDRIRTEKFVLEMLNIFKTYNGNINYGFFIAYVPIENITKKLCIECVKYGANVNDIPAKFIDSDLCKLCIDSGGDMYDIETLGIDNDIIDKLIEDGYLEKCDNGIFISKKYRNY